MIAEIMTLKSQEGAWVLGFVHVESLKSNKNCDPIVIPTSKTQ